MIPIDSPPIEGGVVTIEGSRISAVGRSTSVADVRDLGDVAILPGLINPHTHLEFSDLHQPLGSEGMPFAQWIDTVVSRRRRDATVNAASSHVAKASACEAGLRESLRCGVTMVGDIVTFDPAGTRWPNSPVACLALRELMALTPGQQAEQLAVARKHVAPQADGHCGHFRGLSPHAPYTAGRDLVAAACRLSREHRCPVAMHLAESPEEIELLAAGTGPFRDLLMRLDAWDQTAFPGGNTPADFLDLLSAAHRSLIIHGNYLDAPAWSRLADCADRMTVVYCPRTHHYFGHKPYRLSGMLERGVKVVIGTDGRASNPDLNMLAELRFAATMHADVAPEEILRMGTIGAAEALGCRHVAGSLMAGKRADLIAVPFDGPAAADPFAALIASNHPVVAVMCGGTFIELP